MRLGDVATYINGYAFKPSDYSETGRPIIRIQDLTGNAYETNAFDGIIDDMVDACEYLTKEQLAKHKGMLERIYHETPRMMLKGASLKDVGGFLV